MMRFGAADLREEKANKKRASSSLSKRGLGVPKKERDDKDTQDGINRLRDLVKLRSFFIETAKFRFERRLRVSAKFLSPNGISPPLRLFLASHPWRKDANIIAKLPRLRRGSFHQNAQRNL